MPPRFDRSLLPEARFEFALVADTHYVQDVQDVQETRASQVEFASRRLQSPRAATALQQVAALEADFVVHLGDLVQEYPGTPDFEPACAAAQAQLRACGLERVYHVAGNHDLGDKPDPTMPTPPVEEEQLEAYHRRFGPSWYSFDHRGLHFVVLNSQIMNVPLEAAGRQQRWFEADLRAAAGRRIVVFMHLPPYLSTPGEPALGHYDNLGEPARSWLLELLRRHRVELLVSAHLHFAFCDQAGPTHYRVAPSTSFTRPGFGHLFAGAAPEQGRDDSPKLGFYCCRVLSERIDIHFVRTHGATGTPAGAARLLTPPPAALDRGRLGLTLTHLLAPSTQLPLAWPSVVRQPARNDYPLLACLELGLRTARFPAADLRDSLQARRLALLGRQGVLLQAAVLCSAGEAFEALRQGGPVDAWEWQLPGVLWPGEEGLRFLRERKDPRPLSLCPVLPGVQVAGKQHPRTRLGYLPGELPELNRRLQEGRARIAAALCRLEGEAWDAVAALRRLPPLGAIGRIDLLFEFPSTCEALNSALAAEALFAAFLLPAARLFVEPFLDLDRSMDLRCGLLDTLCNPRPVFEVLRCLHAALHPFLGVEFTPRACREENMRVLRLEAGGLRLALLLPAPSRPGPALFPAPGGARVYHLREGRVERLGGAPRSALSLAAPTLLVLGG